MIEPRRIAQSGEETDGRRRRSLDSRAQIVSALLDLVRQGDVAPSAERVAARANVALRTVFRQFNDMDSLLREMWGVIESELAAVLAAPLVGSDWRERFIDLIAKRAVVHEKIAPYRRAANANRHRSAFLFEGHGRMVASARRALEAILPESVRNDLVLVEMLDLLLSFETWSRLRSEQGLSVPQARDCLELTVRRLIGSAPEGGA
jgi:AcrR family transcriptional regulator